MWNGLMRGAVLLSAMTGWSQTGAAARADQNYPQPGPATGAQAPGNPTAGVPSAAAPVAAVWRERHVDFVYLGRTARYSCDGLRDKVRALLVDLGARRDLKILTIGCDDHGEVSTHPGMPSLSMTFSSPSLPDAATKPLHEGDLAATDARFVPFTITSDAFRNLGIGDCEMVDAFARQILPKLAARDVKRDITCVPNQLSGSRFLLQGQILKALPRAEPIAAP
jgi:hypothetical protein